MYRLSKLVRPGRVRYFASAHETASLNTTRRQGWFKPSLFVLGSIPLITLGLGVWQLRRLEWKLALIDEVEGRIQADPMILTSPKFTTEDALKELEYRRVLLKGKWDHAHTIFLGPKTRDNVHGYNVITPMVLDDGSKILVNRGFVSNAMRDSVAAPQEEVIIEGFVRPSAVRGRFTPDNDPSRGTWYWADVAAMSKIAGAEDAGHFLIEEIFTGHGGDAELQMRRGEAIGRTPTPDLRNMHATYAATWFSLSAATAAMFGLVVLQSRRGKGSARGRVFRMPSG
ncbi:hypothetical protein SISSUDRAFT_1071485 [Sistotremastrum suecicum HHB10207 ss-3]|uniref:SURF1-like protein n=1 Tax=Sistotremastrum suecicum HHB10207 ss-3 TaxID=1314776 RepID=A0A166BP61_9AGAM|nr:hypothetical protein SISSUDRAFT_1071485 [Sistotremastrum suecicum HHB10207 ss-3]